MSEDRILCIRMMANEEEQAAAAAAAAVVVLLTNWKDRCIPLHLRHSSSLHQYWYLQFHRHRHRNCCPTLHHHEWVPSLLCVCIYIDYYSLGLWFSPPVARYAVGFDISRSLENNRISAEYYRLSPDASLLAYIYTSLEYQDDDVQ